MAIWKDDENEQEQIQRFTYTQELDRKLTVTLVIGLGFTLMGVPFGLSSTLWISLVDGGSATMLYGWIVVAFFSTMVVLSLSEIISKYPTAGGVYHWSAILASPKYSMFASWLTGWLLVIGSWTYSASIMYAGSQFIVSILSLKSQTAVADPVFTILGVYFILVSFCGLVNFMLAKYLEKFNKLCIVWLLYTVLAIDILLIFYSKRTNLIRDILTSFDNSRLGWPDPIAFMVGLQALSFTLTGYGMIFSICDEVRNPERNMPKGTIRAILLASAMGLIFILPVLTILPEMRLLLDTSPDVMPIDLVFKLATELYLISFLLALLLVGTVIFQAVGSLTTASRTTYAFARDGGLPFLAIFAQVQSSNEYTIPRNALILSMVVPSVLSLLSLVLSAAFNAFMGALVVALATANGIPIFCSMMGRRQLVKGGAYRLRKWGWLVNGLLVAWVMVLLVVLCLPPVIKGITWHSMNYASLVIVFFFGVAVAGYKTWGMGEFHGPQIDTGYYTMNQMESSEQSKEPVGGLAPKEPEHTLIE